MGRRFFRIWVIFAALYTVLAAVGPNGPRSAMVWPQVNQHLLLTRAWIGEDIELPETESQAARTIAVGPRLDVTPYFRNRVVADPREQALMGNLAVVLPGCDREQPWLPAQEHLHATGGADADALESMVCHVGFPPGPAFLLLPLRLLMRGFLATQWISALLGGLAVAFMDRLFSRWQAYQQPDSAGAADPSLLVLTGLGTLWIWLVPDGGTNFFAQTVATTCLTAALVAVWEKRFLLAGLAVGLAATSRPSTLGAVPLLLLLLWIVTRKAGPRTAARALAKLAVFPALAGGVTLLLNDLRFGSALDFGYAYMLTPPDILARMVQHGQMSLIFLAENFRYLIVQPPLVIRDPASGDAVFPFLASDPFGMGIFFVTPAFLALAATLHPRLLKQPLVGATWISLILVCLPGLLYFNTGWVQWGGRFLLDAWPLFLLLAATGLEHLPRPIVLVLITASVISNLWAVILTVSGVWPRCCF